MGWGDCGTDSKGRKIGYLHRGKCDHQGCKTRIDRGVANACGGMHGTGEGGCEGYFCSKHLFQVEDPLGWVGRQQGFAVLCEACKNEHNAQLMEELVGQTAEMRKELDKLKTANEALAGQNAELRSREAKQRFDSRPRPHAEWHEDVGPVPWWKYPVEEPPYCGGPLDCDNWPFSESDEERLYWTPIDGNSVQNAIAAMRAVQTTRKPYDNPDFAALVRETVTVTHPDGKKASSRRVVPADGATPAEFAKALVLANARYGALMELPYLIDHVEDEAAEAWRLALTDDNPPAKVSFRRGKEGYPAFRELVIPLEFTRFDPVRTAEIRAMYATSGPSKREVDAEEIAQAELDGEAGV